MTRYNIFGVDTAKLWIRERIRNEFEALRYIRENTTIRVPEPIRWSQTEDGYYTLFCKYVDGVSLDKIGDICYTPQQSGHRGQHCAACRDEATRKWHEYYHDVVRSQLSALTSTTTGLGGIVIPPPWVIEHDRRPEWPVKTADQPIFVFSQGDMAYHNVICDPRTREVAAVCDWENAGFYPEIFCDLGYVNEDEKRGLYTNTARLDSLIESLMP